MFWEYMGDPTGALLGTIDKELRGVSRTGRALVSWSASVLPSSDWRRRARTRCRRRAGRGWHHFSKLAWMVLHFLIGGRVQGVGWLVVHREASELDLRGWVRNTEDRDVEVLRRRGG